MPRTLPLVFSAFVRRMKPRNTNGNVFVGNLPPDFQDARLAEIFDPFGIVLSAVVGTRSGNRRATAVRLC